MNDQPKDEFLRDHLAVSRTTLANERTFLAYVRTALAILLTGFSFIRFFNDFLIEVIGWVFIPIAVITFIIGMMKYYSTAREIAQTTDDHFPHLLDS